MVQAPRAPAKTDSSATSASKEPQPKQQGKVQFLRLTREGKAMQWVATPGAEQHQPDAASPADSKPVSAAGRVIWIPAHIPAQQEAAALSSSDSAPSSPASSEPGATPQRTPGAAGLDRLRSLEGRWNRQRAEQAPEVAQPAAAGLAEQLPEVTSVAQSAAASSTAVQQPAGMAAGPAAMAEVPPALEAAQQAAQPAAHMQSGLSATDSLSAAQPAAAGADAAQPSSTELVAELIQPDAGAQPAAAAERQAAAGPAPDSYEELLGEQVYPDSAAQAAAAAAEQPEQEEDHDSSTVQPAAADGWEQLYTSALAQAEDRLAAAWRLHEELLKCVPLLECQSGLPHAAACRAELVHLDQFAAGSL